MIVVFFERTEPSGGISVKSSSDSKLCVRIESTGVQSMWLGVANEKPQFSRWGELKSYPEYTFRYIDKSRDQPILVVLTHLENP